MTSHFHKILIFTVCVISTHHANYLTRYFSGLFELLGKKLILRPLLPTFTQLIMQIKKIGNRINKKTYGIGHVVVAYCEKIVWSGVNCSDNLRQKGEAHEVATLCFSIYNLDNIK